MPGPKTSDDRTFDQLVDEAVRGIHLSMLAEGGKGMRSSVFTWMSTAIQWNEAKEKKTCPSRSERR